ncbi:PTS lactose/cellobiose transporter subunit IIA [Pectinatus sottacetonis]|uniref:PTS lactose/cellobiose transporter subunit IIA n=1 Tax=Pectinatus sottacetonis TaxID=1002795 RepID=UPI0018C54881|nr:PTS lactose/cellobiose transporter subunit IIA [Pectinatus sottacetonis]
MEDNELQFFELISNAGAARSAYIEAINWAEKKDFAKAAQAIAEGDKVYADGHKVHFKLVQNEAAGKKNNTSLLLIHAEDLLIGAEMFKIIAESFIKVYKHMDEELAKKTV